MTEDLNMSKVINNPAPADPVLLLSASLAVATAQRFLLLVPLALFVGVELVYTQ